MLRNERELEKKDYGEIWDMVFGGRYIIFLMGVFSVFTGLIYNDMFSQVLTLMSSQYTFTHNAKAGTWVGTKGSGTYGFGIDPAWHGCENNLIFLNSYKMKMAIIMGVVHMSFGIFLQCYNHIHYGKRINILLDFLPQILFFWSIFGYLVLMIMYKWLNFYPDASKAPGLLNTLIYMFLSPGTLDMQLYPGQGFLQPLLLLVAFVSIPWMLLGKPLYEREEHKRTVGAGYVVPDGRHSEVDIDDGVVPSPVHEEDEDEHGGEYDFGDAMIHQGIHTIEFTLSGISNTASYLRLWALSLAHAQLSEVLWEMILESSLEMENGIAIALGFFFWFVLTVIVLILMEGLSSFLHALRLHWVEFQNKFYAGSGYAFQPFAFRDLFLRTDESD